MLSKASKTGKVTQPQEPPQWKSSQTVKHFHCLYDKNCSDQKDRHKKVTSRRKEAIVAEFASSEHKATKSISCFGFLPCQDNSWPHLL